MSGRTWSVGNPFEGLRVVEAFEASAEQRAAAVERRTARRVLESAVGLGSGGHQDGVREVVGRLEPATFMSQHNPAAHCRAILLAAVESGRLLLLRRDAIVLPASWRVSPKKAEASAHIAEEPTDWIEVLVNYDDKSPHTGSYRLELPNGRALSGKLNLAGFLRIDGIPPGTCTFTLLQDAVIAPRKSTTDDEAESEAENPEDLGQIWIRIAMTPEQAADDTFELRSTDGGYSDKKVARDDHVPNDDSIDLLFENVDKTKTYTLEVATDAGDRVTIFEDVAYEALVNIVGDEDVAGEPEGDEGEQSTIVEQVRVRGLQ